MVMTMKKFRTTDSAKEYAELNFGKNECEVVEIDGKETWLSSTCIPLETRFRDPIEESVRSFLKEMGMADENEMDDISMFIGAELSSHLISMIEANSPYKILCAYQNY